MKRTLTLFAVLFTLAALAQVTIPLTASNVRTTAVLVTFTPGDGGCTFYPQYTVTQNDGGLLTLPSAPIGANPTSICPSVKTAACRTANNAVGVGDGGMP